MNPSRYRRKTKNENIILSEIPEVQQQNTNEPLTPKKNEEEDISIPIPIKNPRTRRHYRKRSEPNIEDKTEKINNDANNEINQVINHGKTEAKKNEENKQMALPEVKKFDVRRTMPPLRYKKDFVESLDTVEKKNINKILKGDLADIYEDIAKSYSGFKENIFNKTLRNFENKVGEFDKKKISHFIPNDNYEERFNLFPKTDEVISSYAERIKKIEEDS